MEWETEPYSDDSAPSSLPLDSPLQKTPESLPLLPSTLPCSPAVLKPAQLPFHKHEQANEYFVGLKSQHCFGSTQRLHSNPCCSVRGTPEFIQLLLGKGDVSNPPADLLCSSFAPGYCFKFRNDKLDNQTLFLHCFVFSLYFEHCTKCWRDLLCWHTLCIFCTFLLLLFEISLLAHWRRSWSKKLYYWKQQAST